jgi:hypothetical protein
MGLGNPGSFGADSRRGAAHTSRLARWLCWPAQRFGINRLTVKLVRISVWVVNQAKFTNGR